MLITFSVGTWPVLQLRPGQGLLVREEEPEDGEGDLLPRGQRVALSQQVTGHENTLTPHHPVFCVQFLLLPLPRTAPIQA